MGNEELVLLQEVGGVTQAEILKGLLEAQGIRVVTSAESAGSSLFPTTFGMLGIVQLLVHQEDLERATQILDEYQAGDFTSYP